MKSMPAFDPTGRSRPGSRSRLADAWAKHYPIAVPLIIAVAMLGAIQLTHPALPVIHDALAYTKAAQRLLTDGTYAYGEASGSNATQTPGYALFLAAVYAFVRRGVDAAEWTRAARPLLMFAQSLVALGIVVCVAHSGRQLGGRRLGLIAGVLAAVYPTYAWATTVALSDLLGSLLVAGQLALAMRLTTPGKAPRLRDFVLLGVLAGAVGLVRPAYLPWAAVPLVYVAVQRSLSWRRFVAAVGVCAVAFTLVMMPWWVRNVLVLDRVVVLNTNSGVTMLDALGGRELSDAELAIESVAEAEGKDGATAVAWSRIRTAWQTAPSQYVVYRLSRVREATLYPWSPVRDAYWEQQNHFDTDRVDFAVLPPSPSAFALALDRASRSFQVFLLVAAAVGLLFIPKSPRLILPASLVAYAALAHSWTLFIERYFLPAMAGVMLLAAAGLLGVFVLIRRGGVKAGLWQ